VRQSLDTKDVNMEPEEATALEAPTRQQPVKVQETEDFICAVMNCSVC
jgi:hypothetical protein